VTAQKPSSNLEQPTAKYRHQDNFRKNIKSHAQYNALKTYYFRMQRSTFITIKIGISRILVTIHMLFITFS
jgi:hypothetical protein